MPRSAARNRRSTPSVSQRVLADWVSAAAGWERWEPMIQHSLAAIDPVLLRAADLRPGQRVLDVACGIGDPSLAIARWIEPRGTVLGVDVAPPMIQVARRRAKGLDIRNARFVVGDMQRQKLPRRRFHRIVSRFGIMFVEDIAKALENLHGALAPGGRVAFAVWAEASRNAMLSTATMVMKPYMKEPPPDPEAGPHPMRLGRPTLLPRLLRSAGFRGIRAEEVTMAFVYQSPEQFVEATLEISSASRALYAKLSRADQARVRVGMAKVVGRFKDGALYRLPGVARVVSATR
jgi:enediyne biosynthesis protein CalE5